MCSEWTITSIAYTDEWVSDNTPLFPARQLCAARVRESGNRRAPLTPKRWRTPEPTARNQLVQPCPARGSGTRPGGLESTKSAPRGAEAWR